MSKIEASILPPLFSLVDLLKDPVPGQFYREQLTLAPNPNFKTDFFEIEKIIKSRIFRKKKYYLGYNFIKIERFENLTSTSLIDD